MSRQTGSNFDCGTRKISLVPGTVKPTNVQATPPNSQRYSYYNATQKKGGKLSDMGRAQTHPGRHPASDSCRGAVERAEGPSPRGRLSVPQWAFLCERAQAPFQSIYHLASTMTSGNEVYSPLTPPVKHILAGFKPAASHFVKRYSSCLTRKSKYISLLTFSRSLSHPVFQALLFLT